MRFLASRLYSSYASAAKKAAAPIRAQSDRTYREELYGARRFTVNPNRGSTEDGNNGSGQALSRLNYLLRSEKFTNEIRRRRQFITPSKERILKLFKSRQDRFNQMVKGTLGKILDIYESRK